MKIEQSNEGQKQDAQANISGQTSHAQTISPTLPQTPDMKAGFNEQSARTQIEAGQVPPAQKAFAHLEPRLVPGGDLANIRAAADRQGRENTAIIEAKARQAEKTLTNSAESQKCASDDKRQAASIKLKEGWETAIDRNAHAQHQKRRQERTY